MSCLATDPAQVDAKASVGGVIRLSPLASGQVLVGSAVEHGGGTIVTAAPQAVRDLGQAAVGHKTIFDALEPTESADQLPAQSTTTSPSSPHSNSARSQGFSSSHHDAG